MTRPLLLCSCLLLLLVGCSGSAASTETEAGATVAPAIVATVAATATGPGTAMAARELAADEGKYLFAFFWKTDDEGTVAMRKLFDESLAKITDRANTVAVRITDTAEKAIVDEYDLERAPMPLVLAIAPNGAITGGFPNKFSEHDLLSALATPTTQQCMKHLQSGKLVFLCVQNDETGANEAAMKGIKEFVADDRFRTTAKIVVLDPSDEAEKSFLNDLQVDTTTKTAVTVFLAPPGSPIAMYEGATSKSEFLGAIQKAGSCGPGGVCGPGGCGPQ